MYSFGSGSLIATPTIDASGNAIVNPTPIEFGVLQDVSFDISSDNKTLYGSLQFPVAVGRGKGKISGKAKAARITASLFNAIYFGQTLASGITGEVYDTTGSTVAVSLTPTVPNTGAWSRDLGVKDTNGLALVRVSTGPTTGQYSVAAGVYTFASADVGKLVYISFAYTAASTTAATSAILNLPMGYAPSFSIDFYLPYNGKSMTMTFPNAIASKLTIATKQDDFLIPEFDFDCFANGAGQVMTYSVSDK